MRRSKFSGPLYDYVTKMGFTPEKLARQSFVNIRSIHRMLRGENIVTKKVRPLVLKLLQLTEVQLRKLVDRQSTYTKKRMFWRHYMPLCKMVQFGVLQDYSDVELLKLNPAGFELLRDWCDNLIRQRQAVRDRKNDVNTIIAEYTARRRRAEERNAKSTLL